MATLNRLKQVLQSAILMSVLAGGAFAIYLGWYMGCDWVPDATVARLPNASKAEVRQLLGEPDHPTQAQDEAKTWDYRRPWRLAEFQIWFGPDGRVKEWYYDR